MRVIIALDDKNGMTFNNRRQSRDSVMNRKITDIVNDKTLFMAPYSEKLFEGSEMKRFANENFLDLAKKEDFCFVEEREVPIEKCVTIFVFRWNRVYPADRFFDHDLIKNGFCLESSEEFIGSSHEKITLEVFEKAEKNEK